MKRSETSYSNFRGGNAMRRHLTLILALVVIALTFVACDDSTGNPALYVPGKTFVFNTTDADATNPADLCDPSDIIVGLKVTGAHPDGSEEDSFQFEAPVELDSDDRFIAIFNRNLPGMEELRAGKHQFGMLNVPEGCEVVLANPLDADGANDHINVPQSADEVEVLAQPFSDGADDCELTGDCPGEDPNEPDENPALLVGDMEVNVYMAGHPGEQAIGTTVIATFKDLSAIEDLPQAIEDAITNPSDDFVVCQITEPVDGTPALPCYFGNLAPRVWSVVIQAPEGWSAPAPVAVHIEAGMVDTIGFSLSEEAPDAMSNSIVPIPRFGMDRGANFDCSGRFMYFTGNGDETMPIPDANIGLETPGASLSVTDNVNGDLLLLVADMLAFGENVVTVTWTGTTGNTLDTATFVVNVWE